MGKSRVSGARWGCTAPLVVKRRPSAVLVRSGRGRGPTTRAAANGRPGRVRLGYFDGILNSEDKVRWHRQVMDAYAAGALGCDWRRNRVKTLIHLRSRVTDPHRRHGGGLGRGRGRGRGEFDSPRTGRGSGASWAGLATTGDGRRATLIPGSADERRRPGRDTDQTRTTTGATGRVPPCRWPPCHHSMPPCHPAVVELRVRLLERL
ncbi:hypothetical protein P171DRAFT_77317 [Karstenula rhodostoma CBS 690.94]|uniref:Uncharacterized protein n=1 Tax=Karstenula rhodostoma CBS 690.94 TaxID=1392251 RepID=A0A9P4U9Y8_9PLEO|nr:hypothetical protein P171DRAFT_77317 [Karstenula rhodostoma CBS 690.94]